MCFSIWKCIKCWLRKTWCKNKKITNRSSLCPLTEMDWLTWYIWNTTRFTLEKFSYLAFVNVAITGQWNISPTLISREQFCFDNVVLKLNFYSSVYRRTKYCVDGWKTEKREQFPAGEGRGWLLPMRMKSRVDHKEDFNLWRTDESVIFLDGYVLRWEGIVAW